MRRVEQYRAELRRLSDWEPFLKKNSGLPGPRANLELVEAVGEEADAERLWRLEVIKHIELVLIVLGLAACGAQREGPPPQVPAAVTALIQDLKNQPVANPPAYIASYDYSGQFVY